ncbi:MAG: hypothetical protein E2O79_09990 [Caldithrix sp.]|nr:MAG: hypothetical protein E2O79_09990 [Caldithrix sp.]
MPVFQVKADVILPTIPNFITLTGGGGNMCISDFTDEGLRELGNQWTEQLIKNAQEKRGRKE